MTVILNNDEITKLLPMARCLAQLNEAYRELGEGRAISRLRSDIYGPLHDNGRYVFKTMDGMVPKFEGRGGPPDPRAPMIWAGLRVLETDLKMF